MADELGWIVVGPTEFRCPICNALKTINRPSGKQSVSEWELYVKRRWIEHYEEHQRCKSIDGDKNTENEQPPETPDPNVRKPVRKAE